VVRLSLENPVDVLQVFTRVNRTGVQVAGEDVFFAAVKTLWRDAEEHLHRVQVAVPFFSRSSALRIVARCASAKLHGSDVLPLDVEKLNGDRGRALVAQMAELTTPNSEFLRRLDAVGHATIERSGLGHALRHLPQSLWDPVLVWAAERPAGTLDDNVLLPAWSFVLGAATLRYKTIFTETFERMAFETARQRAVEEMPFPLDVIDAHVREKWPNLSRSRQRVRSTGTDSEKQEFVHDNGAICLLVVQGIPFALPPNQQMDWEHLFPSARVDDLRWKGSDGKAKLQRHPGAWKAYRAGNLMALDASLNRAAGKKLPDEKLDMYREAAHWPPDLYLSATEEEVIRLASAAVRDGRIADAAESVAKYVAERESRIFAEVTRRFPGIAMLANNTIVE
jgi:hypothetical protein